MTLAENFDRMAEFTKRFSAQGLPDPPAWVSQLPLLGEPARAYWARFAHDTPELVSELKKFVDPIRTALLSGGAGVAEGLLQLTLSVLIAFFFFRDGDAATLRLRAAVARIAPDRGPRLLDVASGTTRGVVYGILGTALAQGVLMAIGLWIAGIGAAPLLGLVTFFLSPVPIGPPLVWIPAAIWLFSQGQTGMGIFMVLWGTLVVSMVDNFLKPIIISRGSQSAVSAGDARHSRWRCRLRLHRRISRSSAAGAGSRAIERMGGAGGEHGTRFDHARYR
jgi:predicted PurR-regulated permease PerM